MRRFIATAILGLLAASPLAAQKPQKGTWELGAFGRYNWYDEAFNQIDSTSGKNSWGLGGRLGYFFSPRWSLELDGSANPTDLDRSATGGATSVGLVYQPYHLRALYHAPIGERTSWIIGGGLNYNRYRVTSSADEFLEKRFEGDDFGIGGLTGFRYKLSDMVSVRFDGTLDFIPSPDNDDNSNVMLGVQGGLSLFLGGGCRDRVDSIRVEPRTQNIFVGDRATLRVSGYECDGDVIDATGTSTGRVASGQGSLAGMTFTGTQAGCSDIEVTNAGARRKKTDTVRVCVQERPAPPRVTLDRCEVQPATSTVPPGQTVNFRVIGFYSDGTSRELDQASLNADGGTISGRTYTAPGAAGTYTITAQCGEGRSGRATVTVRPVSFTLRALFEFDKTNVFVQAERDSLIALSDLLKQYPNLSLTIYGHTDWRGSVAYNDRLGTRRIQAVMDTLAAHGIDRARMNGWVRTSYGECQPIADNGTDAGRALNRRVEVYDTPTAKRYEGSAQCRNRP